MQEVTLIALSAHTRIAPLHNSNYFENVTKKGLIKRQEHETDTRAKNVELNEIG